MDNVLAKHLVAAFMPKTDVKEPLVEETEGIIHYSSYKIVDDSYYIKTKSDIIVSETFGYWKDKPVLTYNDGLYVMLEQSNSIVSTDSLRISKEQITRIPDSIKKKVKKQLKEAAQNPLILTPFNPNKRNTNNTSIFKRKLKTVNTPTEDAEEKKEKVEDKPTVSVSSDADDVSPVNAEIKEPVSNEKDQSQDNKLDAEVPKEETSSPTNSTENYTEFLRTSDDNKVVENDDNDFLSSLDKNKDDPRVKQFFNYHSDLIKKDLFSIMEKFHTQQISRVMESGGGTNAVQYANGGKMDGDLVVTGNLAVTGNITGSGLGGGTKRVFDIGDGIQTSFTLLHNMNTRDVVVSIYDNSYNLVNANIQNDTLNTTVISFNSPIATNSMRVVIIG